VSNIGYMIVKNFKRPSKELIEGFKDIPVANIDDCMNRTAAIDSAIKPLNKAKLLGPAFTVSVPAGDNLLFYYAIDQAKPGDIIVITDGGFSDRALCGEIMTTLAKKRGIGGFLIDGAVRDFQQLSQSDFPVFARNATPNGPVKNGPGEINVPINLGGKVVFPGDIIVGDSDGVVVIRPQYAQALQKMARAIMEKEEKCRESILSKGEYDFSWVYQKLQQGGCDIIID